jgi:chemotaxis signal transduction protein
MKALVASKAQESQQYLTFLLDDQEYGLEIFKIREIRGYSPITPIPNVPPHVRGVMNLRGTVLPVIDLRMKFHLPSVGYNKFTVDFGTAVDTRFINGVFQSKQRLTVALNLEKLLTECDIAVPLSVEDQSLA